VVRTAGTDAAGGRLPLLPAERLWRGPRLFVVLLVAASATWCFVIGEYVGYPAP
jgi:hypothetical protein